MYIVLDRFKDLHPHGVLFERRKWLADGDSCCSLVVRDARKHD